MTAPTPLWRFVHGRIEAVHMIASITVVTEQKLIVIFRGAAHVTTLALDALPAVRLHGRHHYRSELQAGRVA